MMASRVILMKAADLAQEHAAEQADWQKNGSGGIVSAVDPGTGTITVSSGTRKIQVHTSSTTIFRRYASDSVKFEDAKPGALTDLHPGDQMRVLGTKSPDGMSIAAKEIVSGTFADVAGLLATVDATAGTITLKDLTTKKMVTVLVTANSDLRALPPQMSAMFVQRARGGQPHDAVISARHGMAVFPERAAEKNGRFFNVVDDQNLRAAARGVGPRKPARLALDADERSVVEYRTVQPQVRHVGRVLSSRR